MAVEPTGCRTNWSWDQRARRTNAPSDQRTVGSQDRWTIMFTKFGPSDQQAV